MSLCVLATGRNRAPTFAAGLVVYYPLGGDAGEPNNLCITESMAEMVARENLTISLYSVSCDARSRHGPTQYNIRKNEANGGPAISVAMGLNGVFTDTVSLMALAPGDKYCQAMTYDTNTGNATNNWTTAMVTGMTKKPACFFQQGSQQSGIFTRYGSCCGSSGMVYTSTETAMQLVAQGALTVSNLFINILANTHAGAITYNFRKNAAAGNLTVSVGAGLTGNFEDTTHTDTLADLDKYCFQFIAGNSGNVTFGLGACLISQYPDGTWPLNMCAEAGGIGSLSPDLTGRFSYMVGALASNGNSFITQNGIYMPVSGVSSGMWINILTNPSTTAVAINFFRNNIQGNQALSIGAGLTGVFRDTVNSDSFNAGDQLLYNVGFSTTGQTTAAGGGTKAAFYHSGVAAFSMTESFTPAPKLARVGTITLSSTQALSAAVTRKMLSRVTLAIATSVSPVPLVKRLAVATFSMLSGWTPFGLQIFPIVSRPSLDGNIEGDDEDTEE